MSSYYCCILVFLESWIFNSHLTLDDIQTSFSIYRKFFWKFNWIISHRQSTPWSDASSELICWNGTGQPCVQTPHKVTNYTLPASRRLQIAVTWRVVTTGHFQRKKHEVVDVLDECSSKSFVSSSSYNRQSADFSRFKSEWDIWGAHALTVDTDSILLIVWCTRTLDTPVFMVRTRSYLFKSQWWLTKLSVLWRVVIWKLMEVFKCKSHCVFKLHGTKSIHIWNHIKKWNQFTVYWQPIVTLSVRAISVPAGRIALDSK